MCFQCHFWIFLNLDIFFIMTRAPYMVSNNTGYWPMSQLILGISLSFLAQITYN